MQSLFSMRDFQRGFAEVNTSEAGAHRGGCRRGHGVHCDSFFEAKRTGGPEYDSERNDNNQRHSKAGLEIPSEGQSSSPPHDNKSRVT